MVKKFVDSSSLFYGTGLEYKLKLFGSCPVDSSAGDLICLQAIKKLKAQALAELKEKKTHKQQININLSFYGIKLLDGKSHELICVHPVNKISFIICDPEDKRTFGYVVSVQDEGFKFFAFRTSNEAIQVIQSLHLLFQKVLERVKAGLPPCPTEDPSMPPPGVQPLGQYINSYDAGPTLGQDQTDVGREPLDASQGAPVQGPMSTQSREEALMNFDWTGVNNGLEKLRTESGTFDWLSPLQMPTASSRGAPAESPLVKSTQGGPTVVDPFESFQPSSTFSGESTPGVDLFGSQPAFSAPVPVKLNPFTVAAPSTTPTISSPFSPNFVSHVGSVPVIGQPPGFTGAPQQAGIFQPSGSVGVSRQLPGFAGAPQQAGFFQPSGAMGVPGQPPTGQHVDPFMQFGASADLFSSHQPFSPTPNPGGVVGQMAGLSLLDHAPLTINNPFAEVETGPAKAEPVSNDPFSDLTQSLRSTIPVEKTSQFSNVKQKTPKLSELKGSHAATTSAHAQGFGSPNLGVANTAVCPQLGPDSPFPNTSKDPFDLLNM